MSKEIEKVIIRQNPNNQKFTDIYIMGAVVYFASVHEPVNKLKSTAEKEYKLTAFIDDDAAKLLKRSKVNKQFFKVGVTENKEGFIKYPLESQLEPDKKFSYDAVDGKSGVSLTRHQWNSKGKSAYKKWCGEGGNPAAFVASSDMMASPVTVVDKDGKPLTALVGNGSVCNIKLFAYTNQDGQYVVSLDTLKVVDLVEYVPSSSSNTGVVEDDILGSYQRNTSVKDEAESKSEPKHNPADDFDDDTPPF